jgi:outer membrane protein
MRFFPQVFEKILTVTTSSVLLLLFFHADFSQNAPSITGNSTVIDGAKPLSLAEAIDLALNQASTFRAAQFNERLAAEDIRQAKAGLYPRITAQPNLIYTSPSFSKPADSTPRLPSFLGANAITEFQAVINAAGEIDTSGRLRATLKRSRYLLEAARAGSEVAKRDLANAVTDAYFNLALATVRRRGAELNTSAAEEFENNLKLQLDAGEIAPVDLVRARLQTAQRRDELEQARANEAVNADALRVYIGYDFTQMLLTEDLLTQLPNTGEIENFTQTTINTRPEFAQFEAERLAAEQDAKIAKAERKPQITYSVSGGFISDSLRPNRVGASTGVQANVGVTLPIFDWGAIRSRETQARLRIQLAENNRQIAEKQFIGQFFTARTQAMSAASRIKQIGDSLKDAEMNLSASAARYNAGEASIVEVTDAQNTLITLRLALYQAIFDYQTARARFLRAIGR